MVVVVIADGLMAVPPSVHTPSVLTPATESIGANLWLAVRHPLLALTPSPRPLVYGGVRRGGAAGGIVLIWRGVTTPVNTPNDCDTGFYCLPSKDESSGGITHMAFSPEHVVGHGRVMGPLT